MASSPTFPVGTAIRVYCTFEDKTVEYCWDAGGTGWYRGGYTID